MFGKCKACGFQAGMFNLKKGLCEFCRGKNIDMEVRQEKRGNAVKHSLLSCKDCSKVYLLGDDAYIASISEIFEHLKYPDERGVNIYFVMARDNCNNDDKVHCTNEIESIKRKINDAIPVHWICHSCNDIKNQNEFPRYFGNIYSLQKDILYSIMAGGDVASVIIKKAFLIKTFSNEGSEPELKLKVILLGTQAMEKILGLDHSPNFRSSFGANFSTVSKEYKGGHTIKEIASCTELLQENVSGWNVPGWVITFQK